MSSESWKHRIPLQVEASSEIVPSFHLSNQLKIVGRYKEKFSVQFLEEDIVRVTFLPQGKPLLDRTWIRCDENNDVPLQGIGRDDLSRFACPQVTVERDLDSSMLTLKGTKLQIKVQIHNTVALYWQDSDGRAFLEDRPMEAYVSGKEQTETYHYLARKHSEHYYGFGETSGELDKYGSRIRMDPRDALGYDAETSDPLYKHHPFYITWNSALAVGCGILYDTMLPCTFDMGKEIQAIYGSYRYFSVNGGDIDYYVIYGPSIVEIMEKLAKLTGFPPRIPRWALYYLGSGMFYTESNDAEQQLKDFVSNCRRYDIVCTGFHLSSGYSTDSMKRRQMFYWNKDKIPNVPDLVHFFQRNGMHLIANVKPWLLCSNPHYGVAKNLQLFVYHLNEKGVKEPCLFPLWSSEASISEFGSYLDFTNEATMEWWIHMLGENYLAFGIDGIWNDNNEWDVCDWNSCIDLGYSLKQIGRPIQSLWMAKASRNALLRYNPSYRPFVVSRSTCLGMQRYISQSWSGDNHTSWKTLQYNIPMSLGMSLSGFPFVGHDTGGFYGPKVDPELFIRWIQLNIFMPRFVIHSGWNSVDEHSWKVNEPWMYPTMLDRVRHALSFRQQLIPYLYNLHILASETGHPVVRPLVYHFPSDKTCATESFSFLLGSWLLVHPITRPNERTTFVYLPESCQCSTSRTRSPSIRSFRCHNISEQTTRYFRSRGNSFESISCLLSRSLA
ncbi:Alpha-glucosidase 2 [Galdieria sulphuraria]|nr:Alpha-glucosidase 2 [Galdieria sulphuraria]